MFCRKNLQALSHARWKLAELLASGPFPGRAKPSIITAIFSTSICPSAGSAWLSLKEGLYREQAHRQLPGSSHRRAACGLTITRVGAHLGAEITGVDLRKPMSDEVRDAIEDALAENELLIFRNQDISSQNLIDFGSRFGELTVHPFAPKDKDVSVLIKFRNDETNPPFRTDVWHSDETFRKEPPKATMLVAKEVPAIGGDTMFASMSAAFEGSATGCSNSFPAWKRCTISSRSASCSTIPRRTGRT